MQKTQEIPILDANGLRKFAFTFALMICLIFGFILPFVFDYEWPIWPWLLSGVMCLWGGLLPESFNFVYQVWMRFGILMGKITTPLILGILFYLVITPVAIVMRVLKKDPMKRKFEKESHTYRVLRDESIESDIEKPF